ncbi:MAG: DUF86 domain-containing protein [Thermomicrobiales bacterium]
MQPRTRDLFSDALAACDYISATIDGVSAAGYVRDEDTRIIVERKLIVIGEAFVRVRERDPEAFSLIEDARPAIALRNIIVHDYNNIDDGRILLIVTELPPILRDSIVGTLSGAEGDPLKDGEGACCE